MLINIFCVLLLVPMFPSTLGDVRIQNLRHRRYAQSQAEHEQSTFGSRILRLRISYIYEINKKTKLTPQEVEKKVKSAIKRVSDLLEKEQKYNYGNGKTVLIYIESIRQFNNPGKPLAYYSAEELSKFLNDDTHFGKPSRRTDNTQIIALDHNRVSKYPEEIRRRTGWLREEFGMVKLPGESAVAVTTHGDICSKKSRGVIIDRKGSTINIANLLTRNLACASGIKNKYVCLEGFRRKDNGPFECPDNHELCYISAMLKNYHKGKWMAANNTCLTNRMIRYKPSTHKSSLFVNNDLSETNDERNKKEKNDDKSVTTNIVLILLAVLGSFLFLAVLVGVCLWWINNRKKTRKLTTDRVSVNYKYDPMKPTDRHSIITDPAVTNDLK